MEFIVLSVFAAALLLCIVFDLSILYALVFGLVLFGGYALYRKHSFLAVVKMALSGIKDMSLITFLLIGMITAFWRACGTIPYIVHYSTMVCFPQIMVFVTFILCCLISFLTGTAFGTAATIGVICATISTGMGVPIYITGGAVLAGSFFGDRCSPMSTSALLVANLTKTDIFQNIRNMVKTAIVPFLLTCAFYLILGATVETKDASTDIGNLIMEGFTASWLLLLPALAIILLSLLKVDVKITMTVSILLAILLSLWLQKMELLEVLKTAVFGYTPKSEALVPILSGGGILSMKNVFFIVCISSCYAGIFKQTGLLDRIKQHLLKLAKHTTPFGSILITSIITSLIACNQTLSIMLTFQLCDDVEPDSFRMASNLENTAVVIAALIPWSIAGAVPLSSVNAPTVSILFACYLYLLPLWNFAIAFIKQKKDNCTVGRAGS